VFVKSFGNGGGNANLSPRDDLSFMIFYVLVGTFLMSGVRALVWLGYGDDPKAEINEECPEGGAPAPSN
jgi:hypothetical protein